MMSENYDLYLEILDIDECAEGTDRCAQNCHNTIGSYTCSCNVGYRLNSNGYDCDGRCDNCMAILLSLCDIDTVLHVHVYIISP